MAEAKSMFNNHSSEEKIKYFNIYFLSGSLSDLSKLDFSPFHVRCCSFDSFEAYDFYKKVSVDEFTEKVIKRKLSEYQERLMEREKLFVFIPTDSTEKIQDDNYIQCRNVLLLMFPSILSFKHVLHFKIEDRKYLNYSYSTDLNFNYSRTGDYDDEFLDFQDDDIEAINSFIGTFAKRIKTYQYLKTSVNTYISSYQEMNPVMEFLCLCMTLESTVNGFSELTYRLGRNLAILVGKDKESAEQISDNIKVIYDLRSKIIHGGDYSSNKVLEFLPYVRILASCTLVKLFQLNIPNLNDLNRLLMFTGFTMNEMNLPTYSINTFISDYDYSHVLQMKLEK